MITTPVIEQYNRIDLPSQNTSQTQEPPKLDDQFITIEASGQFRWGKDPVSQLTESKLDEVAAVEGDQPTIHIRGPILALSKDNGCCKYAKIQESFKT